MPTTTPDLDPATATPAERDPSGNITNYVALSADKVKEVCSALVVTGELTPEMSSDIFWLFGWIRGSKLTESGAAKIVGLDASTIHRVLRGQYGASYAGVCAKIARFRKITEARAHKRDAGFVETSTWKKINAVCTSARVDQLPAFIYGASQIGKTTCLLEFARRNNHGVTKYVRMPCHCSFSYFVRSLAGACYLTNNRYCRIDDMRDRICATLDSTNLLVVDEFHQAFTTCGQEVERSIMEFVREVYDRTQCGIVMSATKLGRREFEGGRNAAVYEQFRRRGMVTLSLPDAPPQSDVNLIAGAYKLDAPTGEVLTAIREMLKRSGVGMYVKYLQKAASVAAQRGEPFTWETFLSVWAGLSALAEA